MKIIYLYAAVVVTDLAAAEKFYAKVLGRKADDHPMDFLVQWRGYGSAGIQLFKDPKQSGKSRLTIVVADLSRVSRSLKRKELKLGEIRTGSFGKIAQLIDPDGNMITFAEPPKRGHRNA